MYGEQKRKKQRARVSNCTGPIGPLRPTFESRCYEERHVDFNDLASWQDSLGGSAKTALIVCCSPAAQDAAESLSALRFGLCAGKIVNNIRVSAVTLSKLTVHNTGNLGSIDSGRNRVLFMSSINSKLN